METSKVIIGALIFIIMVVGANAVMYVFARNWAKPKGSNVLETLGKAMDTSTHKKDNSMEELHKKIEELEKDKKEG
jgi:hypothetical protein